jgi:hypothetical protein
MSFLSLLADLIHQCRLARYEECDSTIETLQISAHDSFAFGRLVCAGQLVRFTVRADLPVSASIKLEDNDDAPALRHAADATNLCIEYLGERTAEHVLIVENDNPVPISAAVEITMELRRQTLRTLIEWGVNAMIDGAQRRTVLVKVLCRERAKRSLDSSD